LHPCMYSDGSLLNVDIISWLMKFNFIWLYEQTPFKKIILSDLSVNFVLYTVNKLEDVSYGYNPILGQILILFFNF
jgi:hypothetical protein